MKIQNLVLFEIEMTLIATKFIIIVFWISSLFFLFQL